MRQNIARCLTVGVLLTLLSGTGPQLSRSAAPAASATTASAPPARSSPSAPPGWAVLSSKDDQVPVSGPREQTAALVLDIDGDRLNDFVIGGRGEAPALTWFRRGPDGWQRYLIEDEELPIEAGGAVADIDGDGDLDIMMGGDYTSSQAWWWENPAPNLDPATPWNRYLIKNSGGKQHHDAIFGDFDGDGRLELIFWNQGAQKLLLADIPADPRATQPWPIVAIFSSPGKAEGLASADIDGDGKLDIVGGGRWFKHTGGNSYSAFIIDSEQQLGRAAAGQLRPGGRPEVVFVIGDGVGRLKWYEWVNGAWVGRPLLDDQVDHGHSLELGDVNGDGHLDIFCAEMRLNGGNGDAKMWVFYGDGQGGFSRSEVATSYGNHESRLADLDGDGDLDILGKPYNWETPRLDIWINSSGGGGMRLDRWERHVIDAERPGRAIFVLPGDIDGDGLPDIVAGGFWYRNPASNQGPWERRPIGDTLNNMAAVLDLDGDGDLDILGTPGDGAAANPSLRWAENDGSGGFTIRTNIPRARGDFLQGVAAARFLPGGPLQIALSWHAAGNGVQLLTVPDDPVAETWGWTTISQASQDEQLSAGDIDGDGDQDLLLGTRWLRNDGGSWSAQTLSSAPGLPDRNRLADINGDGRLDAVVGYEAISVEARLAWYEQGGAPTSPWTERVIATVIGPMSLDVADLDGDGDMDVVVGEHNMAFPGRAELLVFENADGRGRAWVKHRVHVGDEHHDGAQLVDIDGDGDRDIISIGWSHGRVVLYENLSPRPAPPLDGGGAPERPFSVSTLLPVLHMP